MRGHYEQARTCAGEKRVEKVAGVAGKGVTGERTEKNGEKSCGMTVNMNGEMRAAERRLPERRG